MRLENEVDCASVNYLGGFGKVAVCDRWPKKPVRLPSMKAFFEQVVIVRCNEAAWTQCYDFSVNLMWLCDSISACGTDEIANLLFR